MATTLLRSFSKTIVDAFNSGKMIAEHSIESELDSEGLILINGTLFMVCFKRTKVLLVEKATIKTIKKALDEDWQVTESVLKGLI